MAREINATAIIKARIRGESEIARRFKVSVDDVNDCVDSFARLKLTHRTRLHALALDIQRLDDVLHANMPAAKAGDFQAGMLINKTIESRRILLGLAAPRPADQQTIEAQAPPRATSTDRIAEVLERLCIEGRRSRRRGTSARQRQPQRLP
jgi:hypothetical protein